MRLYLQYRADVWVEVDTDEDDVVRVVVDDQTMTVPVEVVDRGAAPAATEGRARALAIADSRDWPSWDYGPPPF
jgi:hypothetical protein